jgi:hypothetical protein
MHNFKINTNDITATYGIFFLEGVYNELLKVPKAKDGLTNNWADQHGTERDLTARYFESRTLNLPCVLQGATKEEFITRLNAFQQFCLTAGYIDLDAEFLNRRFNLCYQEVSNFQEIDGYAASFTLVLIDDFPNTIATIPA